MTAYAFHTSDLRLINYAVAMYGIYLIDRALEYFLYTYPTRIHCAKRIPNTDYIMLKVYRPIGFGKTLPGQYVMLSFPEIDAQLECLHPFTICCDDSNYLTFLIKITGKWTQSLANLVDDDQSCCKLRIIVIGPYGSTLSNFYDEANLTLIGTGIGVTMPMAFLNHTKYNLIKAPNINVHICQRNINDFVPFIETLQNMDRDNNFTVHFYLTQQTCNSILDFSKLDSSNKLIFVFDKDHFRTSRQKTMVVYVHRGRPDFDSIVTGSDVVGVCGTPEINSLISRICRRKGKKCYKETF
jgi:predicted ferric reductase